MFEGRTSFGWGRISMFKLASLCVGKLYGMWKKPDKLKREAITYTPVDIFPIDYTALRMEL